MRYIKKTCEITFDNRINLNKHLYLFLYQFVRIASTIYLNSGYNDARYVVMLDSIAGASYSFFKIYSMLTLLTSVIW